MNNQDVVIELIAAWNSLLYCSRSSCSNKFEVPEKEARKAFRDFMQRLYCIMKTTEFPVDYKNPSASTQGDDDIYPKKKALLALALAGYDAKR